MCLFSLLQKSEVPADYDKHDPEQKQIYRFVRTLFSAAQLTAECAIVTLVRHRSYHSYYWLASFGSSDLFQSKINSLIMHFIVYVFQVVI